MNKLFYLLLILLVSLNYSCKKDTPTEITQDLTPYTLNVGAFPEPDLPADNALTVEKIKLGRMLFYEKNMSSDNTISCASCHLQTNSFNDDKQFSEGVDGALGGRNAMSAINLAWNTNGFFWDGRAHKLRDQSLGPIENPLEMNETLENVILKLSAEQKYKDQFKRAFGTETITSLDMSLAMEQFMFTIISNKSKYDKFLAGEETLTASEERGRVLFTTEYNSFFPDDSGADCVHCHSGFNFENDKYMNNGISTDAEIASDFGRFEETGLEADKGKFKVTTLRNIELTAPYMHDGRFATLEEVIDHYNEGIKTSASLDQALEATQATGLFLTDDDKADILAFLKTLTDHTLETNSDFSEL